MSQWEKKIPPPVLYKQGVRKKNNFIDTLVRGERHGSYSWKGKHTRWTGHMLSDISSAHSDAQRETNLQVYQDEETSTGTQVQRTQETRTFINETWLTWKTRVVHLQMPSGKLPQFHRPERTPRDENEWQLKVRKKIIQMRANKIMRRLVLAFTYSDHDGDQSSEHEKYLDRISPDNRFNSALLIILQRWEWQRKKK